MSWTETRRRTAQAISKARTPRDDWYRITNTGTGTAEVMIYDEIGYWGISASAFVRELNAIKASTIALKINSPGGEIFDGMAIYNAIRDHKATVNVTIDGLAASAASFIAMAGDTVKMNRGSQMMIHDGMSIVAGNAGDFREMADQLDKCSDQIAEIYVSKAGGTVAGWRDKMRAETWYSPAEAVAAGLADSVADADAATNHLRTTIRNGVRTGVPGARLYGEIVDNPMVTAFRLAFRGGNR